MGAKEIREELLRLVIREYPETDEKRKEKIRNIIWQSAAEDCERLLDAFCRFGVREIFNAVGQ